MTSFSQKVTRLVFDIAGRISPDTAGALAFRLFSRTPSKKPSTVKARRALDDARSRMVSASRTQLVISTGCVNAHHFRGSNRIHSAETVLVVHGWGSRSEYMITLIERIRDSGRNVVAIDLPGHGQSSGRSLTMANAVEAIDAAWREFGPFSAVVGHSFGGAVALNSARGTVCGVTARTPRKLVLISAPNNIAEVFVQFAEWIGLPEAARGALYDRVQKVTGRPLSCFVGTRLLAAMPIPAMVIHAPDDKEVSWTAAEEFVAAGSHVRLERAEGLGHRRILNAPEIGSLIAEFIDARPVDPLREAA
ncbi:alpha/beta hydrolase [Hoeflea sp. CAU 1731]